MDEINSPAEEAQQFRANLIEADLQSERLAVSAGPGKHQHASTNEISCGLLNRKFNNKPELTGPASPHTISCKAIAMRALSPRCCPIGGSILSQRIHCAIQLRRAKLRARNAPHDGLYLQPNMVSVSAEYRFK
jgi:hypothetical protein